MLIAKDRALSLKTVPSTFRKVQFSITAIFRPGSILEIKRNKSSWPLQWEKSIGNLQEFERKNLHLLSLQPYIRLVKAKLGYVSLAGCADQIHKHMLSV